jgi:peptide-methionine (S)-S-oxide reductase
MNNFLNHSPHVKFAALILVTLSLSLQGCGQNSAPKTTTPTKTNQTMNTANLDTITLAGGCYWCIEAIYQRLEGVVSVESGFSGGTMKNPSYRDVCTGETGHAECVQITYDKTKTSLDEIFKVFFTVHDPTTLNRQGEDAGTQYRSAIFYRNDEQKKAAESIIADLTKAKVYTDPIVTEVSPYTVFYKAEDYHQDYYNQHGSQSYCQIVIRPKVEKFEKVFKDRLKKQ